MQFICRPPHTWKLKTGNAGPHARDKTEGTHRPGWRMEDTSLLCVTIWFVQKVSESKPFPSSWAGKETGASYDYTKTIWAGKKKNVCKNRLKTRKKGSLRLTRKKEIRLLLYVGMFVLPSYLTHIACFAWTTLCFPLAFLFYSSWRVPR